MISRTSPPLPITTSNPAGVYTPKAWFDAIHEQNSQTIKDYASTHKTQWDTRDGIATNKNFPGTFMPPSLFSTDVNLFESNELLVVARLRKEGTSIMLYDRSSRSSFANVAFDAGFNITGYGTKTTTGQLDNNHLDLLNKTYRETNSKVIEELLNIFQ